MLCPGEFKLCYHRNSVTLLAGRTVQESLGRWLFTIVGSFSMDVMFGICEKTDRRVATFQDEICHLVQSGTNKQNTQSEQSKKSIRNMRNKSQAL